MKPKKLIFSWEKVSLSPLQLKILKILVKEGYPFNQETLSKRTKSTLSGVQKALERLIDYGLVAKIKQSVLSYIINPYRKKEIKEFITGHRLGKNKPLVLSGHAFVYEAEINDLPNKLIKKLEKDPAFLGYCPRGWKYAYRVFLPDGSFKLHKTKKGCKIIAYFRTFGFNPRTIEQLNNEKFLKLKSELEDNYPGLKIGTVNQIAKCPWQEYAILKDLVAAAGIALGIKHKKIEQSYGYPEWEEKGADAAEKISRIILIRELVIDLDKEKLDRAISYLKSLN